MCTLTSGIHKYNITDYLKLWSSNLYILQLHLDIHVDMYEFKSFNDYVWIVYALQHIHPNV